MLDTEVLLREMGGRGWDQNDLAREADVSQPTISAAIRGEAVSARTARAIRAAFDRTPPTLGDLVKTA